ncbi:MAG: hypothetical protein WBG54_08770 [Acidobacteriaceae bacterium]
MKTAESGANTPLPASSGTRPPRTHRAPSKLRPGLILLGSLAVALGALVLVASYLTPGSVAARRAAEAIPAPTAEMPPITEPGAASSSQWSYSMVKTAAGRPERMGCIQSQGTVFLEEPYDNAAASLCFRTDGAAFLKLDGDGEILSGQGHDAKVRFSDGATKSFALEQSDGEPQQMAFVSPASPLFAAAKAGTRITVSAEFGLDAQQTLIFAPDDPLNLAY